MSNGFSDVIDKSTYWDSVLRQFEQEFHVCLSKDALIKLSNAQHSDEQSTEPSVQQHNCTTFSEFRTLLLDFDLRKLKDCFLFPSFSFDSSAQSVHYFKNPLFCQVLSVTDISEPSHISKKMSRQRRLLCLTLHDGQQKFQAIEMMYIESLSIALPPGTKLLLRPSTCRPLCFQNGFLLLYPPNTIVLGGHVKHLVASWKANNDVAEHRATKLYGGEAQLRSSATGAPRFQQFSLTKHMKSHASTVDVKHQDTISVSETKTAKSSQVSDAKEKPKTQRICEGLVPLQQNQQKLPPVTFTSAPRGRGSRRGGRGGASRPSRRDRRREASAYLVQPKSGGRGQRTMFDMVANQLSALDLAKPDAT